MKSSLALRSVCESIGAATITSAALASSYLTDSLITQALLIGLTVTTLIHCFGRISGAHFNPVVTFFLFKDNSMALWQSIDSARALANWQPRFYRNFWGAHGHL